MAPTACDNQGTNLLIIDNDTESVRIILETLAKRAIRGTVAANHSRAIEYVEQDLWTMALIGYGFAESLATDTHAMIIRRLKSHHPEMPLIMLTETSRDAAEAARRLGYTRLIVKPLDQELLKELFDTFVPNHDTCNLARSDGDTRYPYQIIGASKALAKTVQLAKRVAPTSAPVLIAGPSGTGKELIAQLIHTESNRAGAPFVKVNCAALNDSLLESELFGHEKGAFTGAGNRHKGRFERANGGTLLLDEITETQPQFQAKLLRVMESMNFERVGGQENINVNVRIISTTNADIISEVEKRRFRSDLYYRLSAVRLNVPPLHRRPEDIITLVWFFVNQFAHEAARPITSIDADSLRIFQEYHWPGNVRQLRNVVRTALILGSGPALSLNDVPWLIEEMTDNDRTDNQRHCNRPGTIALREVEREAILETLRYTDGNQTKAAKVLGISDRTLREKIRRYRDTGYLASAR